MPATMHAAMRSEPAGNGRPNEVFQHNALLPKPTIGQVQDANVAAHGQESGDWMNTTEDHSRIPRAALLKTRQHMLDNGFTLDPAFNPRTHRDGAPESGSGSGTIRDADQWHAAADQYLERTVGLINHLKPLGATPEALGLVEEVAAVPEITKKQSDFKTGLDALPPKQQLLLKNAIRLYHPKFLTNGKKSDSSPEPAAPAAPEPTPPAQPTAPAAPEPTPPAQPTAPVTAAEVNPKTGFEAGSVQDQIYRLETALRTKLTNHDSVVDSAKRERNPDRAAELTANATQRAQDIANKRAKLEALKKRL
jgi:hypothetical protein